MSKDELLTLLTAMGFHRDAIKELSRESLERILFSHKGTK